MPSLLTTLQAQREAIVDAAKQFGARIWLPCSCVGAAFGSVARGEENSTSDIDFLVDLPPGYDLFAQRLPLAERLMEIIGRRVDLIPEHELNRHLRPYVLAEALDL